jgi:hypothetical protein
VVLSKVMIEGAHVRARAGSGDGKVAKREAALPAECDLAGDRLTRRRWLVGLVTLPLAASLAGRSGPVCRPQEFGGLPDGASDSTGAIRRAIEAVGPAGGWVLIEGGTFCITDQIDLRWPQLAIFGDGALKAGGNELWVEHKAMLEVSAPGVRIEGITLDQDDRILSGDSIRATGAAGLRVHGVTSRNTQRAFVLLGDRCTDVEIAGCRHFGRGWGVLAADGQGLARISIRDCVFQHPGDGSVGDGVEFNCPSHGADTVQLIDLLARGYVGEAKNAGMGFGFCRVRNTLLLRCWAEDCEGDGFHWERGSDDALVMGCGAHRIGRPDPVGGNGSGFVAYDSDRWQGRHLEARDCWRHGIALSGPVSATQLQGGRIRDCAVLGTGRDGLHIAAQRDFEIDRCFVRDPSRSAPLGYAGIRILRQSQTLLGSMDGRGFGNRIELTGATRPLGGLVIDEGSQGVSIEATVRSTAAA